MTKKKGALHQLVLENVSRIEVEEYDANTTTILLNIESDTYPRTLIMTGLHTDLATRLLGALADPNTPIIHGDNFISAYGDWVVTEEIINKLTDEPQ